MKVTVTRKQGVRCITEQNSLQKITWLIIKLIKIGTENNKSKIRKTRKQYYT